MVANSRTMGAFARFVAHSFCWTATSLFLVSVASSQESVATEDEIGKSNATDQESPNQEFSAPIELFDGKTLEGWIQRGGNAKYKAIDGMIVGTAVPNTANSFLCTENDYADFELKLEFRVDDELNSGVQIRSASREDYQNGRVHGHQVEIDPRYDRSWSGGIYDEGRHGWLFDLSANKPAREAFRHNEWNRFRIRAVGKHIQTWINDVPAADFDKATDKSGFIGLQVHSIAEDSKQLQVRWRNISLVDLSLDSEASK